MRFRFLLFVLPLIVLFFLSFFLLLFFVLLTRRFHSLQNDILRILRLFVRDASFLKVCCRFLGRFKAVLLFLLLIDLCFLIRFLPRLAGEVFGFHGYLGKVSLISLRRERLGIFISYNLG